MVGVRILEILVPRHQQVDRSSKEREKQEEGEDINDEEDNSGNIDTTHFDQRSRLSDVCYQDNAVIRVQGSVFLIRLRANEFLPDNGLIFSKSLVCLTQFSVIARF